MALNGRTLMAPRRRIRAVLAGLTLCLATAAIGGISWWRTERSNAQAMAGGVMDLPPERVMQSPQLRFVKAQELAAADDLEGALALYRTLFSDPLLGVGARYNQANLLMRQGLRNREGAEVGQAIALVELAKQGYRAVLRIEPLHWDARYNLERALRLQPDPDEDAAAIGGPRNDAERAPITLRGIPQGLP
jgi:mxaK protein